MLRLALLAAVGLLLSACQKPQTVIISDVTAFHRLSPGMAVGKTLAIEAFPPERQQSLEFAAYRQKLSTAFAAQGLIVVDKAADAEWLAVVTYDIDNGQRESRTYSTPEYGRTGGGTTTYQSGSLSSYGAGTRSGSYGTYSGSTYTPPTYGVTGYSTNTVTTTRYTRMMTIDILDRAALDKAQTVKLYESKLVSSGACGSLAGVFEYMVDGQFANWPGESGKPIVE